MSETTKIQWADGTFNPWIGCTKVSPGCKNCYAENTTRARVLRSQGHETWGKGALRSRTSEAYWKQPLKWNRASFVCDHCGIAQRGALSHDEGCANRDCASNLSEHVSDSYHRLRVFPSLCDWLDDEVPIERLADFLKLIYETPNLDWLLLTKRPENWRDRLAEAMAFMDKDTPRATSEEEYELKMWLAAGPVPKSKRIEELLLKLTRKPEALWVGGWLGEKDPANVWIGTSVENQECADKRIPELLKIPAKVRFLSVEPMLGPIRFQYGMLYGCDACCTGDRCPGPPECDRFNRSSCPVCNGTAKGINLDWVIFGGESGSNARPCNVDWIRDGVKQCQAAGVAAFVKQLGARPFFACGDSQVSMRTNRHRQCEDVIKDPKGGDMAEWPEDLRVRQFPEVKP